MTQGAAWISPTVTPVFSPNRKNDSSNPVHKDEKSFSALLDWMHEHGGRVDPRLGLGSFDGVRGVIALDDISQGDSLLRCPWRLVIGSSSVDQTDAQCDIIMALRKELERAESSPWRHYLRLFNDIDNRIPTLWSPDTLNELQGLPPYDATRHTDWFSRSCLADGLRKELDTLSEQALVGYVTRSCDHGMVPFYDLLNHHNGELNTETYATEFGLEVVACTSVCVGCQVFNSYGADPTADLFRDYGFVEPWPRNWSWIDEAKQVHSFMQLPADIVAIEHTAEFCADLGHGPVP